MSGHSKWSKVKHQKAASDAVKGQAFTKASRAITIAVGGAGGVTDPEKNFRLRLAIEKARELNVPKDTIERAIKRATGEGAGSYEFVTYESYGPGGVAMLIEAATDNKQRTVSAVKNVLDRVEATLASPGAVSFLFSRMGVVVTPKSIHVTYDRILDLAIDSGASDVREADDAYEIYAPAQSVRKVRERFEEEGIAIDNVELIMKPLSTVDVAESVHRAIEALKERLEALEDVQRVYENMA